jgi:hypothetical protein
MSFDAFIADITKLISMKFFTALVFFGAHIRTDAGLFLLFSIMFPIIGAYQIVKGLYIIHRYSVAKSWPKAKGIITLSEMKGGATGDVGSQTSTVYWPVIQFDYTVDNKKYSSQNINWGGHFQTNETDIVERYLKENYPLGGIVEVSYNPIKPSNCVVETNCSFLGILPLWIGVAFNTLPYVFIFLNIYCGIKPGLKRLDCWPNFNKEKAIFASEIVGSREWEEFPLMILPEKGTDEYQAWGQKSGLWQEGYNKDTLFKYIDKIAGIIQNRDDIDKSVKKLKWAANASKSYLVDGKVIQKKMLEGFCDSDEFKKILDQIRIVPKK